MVKKLFFVGIFLFQCLYLISQLNQITFQVDLNNEVISPHGVHIAGDFQSVAGEGIGLLQVLKWWIIMEMEFIRLLY